MSTSPRDTGPATAPHSIEPRVVFSRLAIIALVLTVLAFADATYMQVTHYQAGDVNNFKLSDAATVFVAAGFLAALTIVLFWLSRRAHGESPSPRER
ncbi:MAG: hypothetical protein J2P22_18220 [Nocardioides sp.]|nr:hypothetical protein [Nocardioides sp.]